jgi:hypothetical protein
MFRSAVAVSALSLFWLAGCSQREAEPSPTKAAEQPDYHPSFGDLMTFAVQPRHIKLGISGHARNWTYAAYEASELRNAFKRIGRTIPTFKDQPLPDLFAARILPAMETLDAAVKAQDGAAFDKAYAEVTSSCNACHTSLGKPFVVIHEPTASPYADQDLTTAAPAGPK